MNRALSDEEGFTLVEVVIAMIIMTLVVTAVAAAMIAAADVTGIASTRLSQSDDRQLVEVWLPRDIQSAQGARTYTSILGGYPAATCARQQGQPETTVAILVLTGSGETVTPGTGPGKGASTITSNHYEADYVLTPAIVDVTPGTTAHPRKLIRYFCTTPSTVPYSTVRSKMTVSYDLTSKFAAPTTAAQATVPSSSPGIVTLTLKDAAGNSYSVSGLERS